MRIVLFALLVLAVAVGWIACARTARADRVDSAKARELVQSGARLLDVRTPEEFSEKHLSGAINIPVQALPGRLGELEPRDKPIVLYCRSGHRSGQASGILRGAGFQAVYDLGPMSAW